MFFQQIISKTCHMISKLNDVHVQTIVILFSRFVDSLDELMTLQLFKIAGMARIWILAA